MTIAQITDLHVTTDSDPLNRRRNDDRLQQVLAAIRALHPRPVAIVASGDLVDRGEVAEYLRARAALCDLGIPVYLGLGNHDNRENFLEVFGGPTDPNGFVQYSVDLGDLRLVMCDTLEQGHDGGGFCQRRADWLATTLDEEPAKPTVIALHHPPILSGIQWMDPDPRDPWIHRLASVIRGRDQVRSVICGHVHRAFNGVLAGHLISAAPATSIQLTLNLSPVDMAKADGREILVEEPPGYQLVMLDHGQVITHVGVAGEFASAVSYTRPFRQA